MGYFCKRWQLSHVAVNFLLYPQISLYFMILHNFRKVIVLVIVMVMGIVIVMVMVKVVVIGMVIGMYKLLYFFSCFFV